MHVASYVRLIQVRKTWWYDTRISSLHILRSTHTVVFIIIQTEPFHRSPKTYPSDFWSRRAI